jgi:hypothetical protein
MSFTDGDERWIRNWKPEGVNMKPTKTKPAKRNHNPIIGKLLKLKYKINEAYRSYPHETNKTDKSWVMNLISDVRKNNLTKLSKEDILKCNGLWRDYAGK